MNTKTIQIRGEKVLLIEECILRVHIREPFFSAGKQFGWKGATIGLGISKEALDYALKHGCKIQVTVGEKTDRAYEVAAQTWKDFAEGHGSIMTCKNTQLYIIQWSKALFRTVMLKETTPK